MTGKELVLHLTHAADSASNLLTLKAPWEPLERAIPAGWVAGFMLDGSARDCSSRRVWIYKHGITRRTIGLSEDGRAYQGGRPSSVWEAVEYVYADIESTPYTRDTAYTDDLIAERSRALRQAGWSVVHSAPFRYSD